MKISNVLPFTIRQFPLRKNAAGNPELHQSSTKSDLSENRGYYVCSTARIHVEEEPAHLIEELNQAAATPSYTSSQPSKHRSSDDLLSEIAESCLECGHLVVAIHGYSVSEKQAKHWYEQIYAFLMGGQTAGQTADQPSGQVAGNIRDRVFIGYRWPAESRTPVKLKNAFEALPTLLLGVLLSSFTLGTIAYSLLTHSLIIFGLFSLLTVVVSFYLLQLSKSFNPGFTAVSGTLIAAIGIGLYYLRSQPWLLALIAVLSVFVGSAIITLIILRLVTYARDRYRASNYGTTDLVELIRRLDQRIDEKRAFCKPPSDQSSGVSVEGASSTAENTVANSSIQLSFIAHSLGSEVLTQAIRILSDVFDPQAVDQAPDKCLGESFRLGRLVLVAPDIPIESILSGRANVLKSSLRRFQSAYVFSNEADLALRVASTAANYISFPARNRFRGYKLGNITVQHFKNRYDTDGWNLHNNPELFNKGLEIRASNVEHRNLIELATLTSNKDTTVPLSEDERQTLLKVANAFTYFDCTDYEDIQVDYATGKASLVAKGVVSLVAKQPALNFLNYVRLIFCSGKAGRVDSISNHSGYFSGQLTQDLIYGLAFLGEEKFLEVSGLPDFKELVKYCAKRQIQVVLAGQQT